ncbi:MAG: hypothetical protein LBP87_04005 [Planctomycetaceae bacterium]|jgi:hypothetical protein|nr:hypothetical protein [Planctomycetaceae bacterium]
MTIVFATVKNQKGFTLIANFSSLQIRQSLCRIVAVIVAAGTIPSQIGFRNLTAIVTKGFIMPVLSKPNLSANSKNFPPNPTTYKTTDIPELIRQIFCTVKQETNLGVQEMNIFFENGKWVLTGYCNTFYTKQLAQEAVLRIIGDVDLINQIYVA